MKRDACYKNAANGKNIRWILLIGQAEILLKIRFLIKILILTQLKILKVDSKSTEMS